MPEPLRGLATVAEYGNRFAADVASARLSGYGIHNTVLGDPASTVAPHHVTQPGFSVLVLDTDVDDALILLGRHRPRSRADDEADALDRQYFRRPFRDRPPFVRHCTVLLLLAVAGPVVLLAGAQLWFLLQQVAP